MLNEEEINKEINDCIRSMNTEGLEPNLNNLLSSHVDFYEWTYFEELSHRIYENNVDDFLTDNQIMRVINSFLEVVKGDK